MRTHARKGARGVERKLVPLPAKRRTEHTAAPATGGRGALRQPSSQLLLRSLARWTDGTAHPGPTGEEPRPPGLGNDTRMEGRLGVGVLRVQGRL